MELRKLRILVMTNKTSTYLISILSLLSLLGCKNSNEVRIGSNQSNFREFPQKDTVYFSDALEFKEGIPYKLFIQDSTLLVFNISGSKSSFFYQYSLATDKITNRFLPGGRGPGEALSIISSGVIGNILWGYDISLKKLLTINMDSISFNKNFKEYKVSGDFYSTTLINNSRYFGVGDHKSEYKIHEIDLMTGNELDLHGKFDILPKDVPFSAFKSAHDCFILTNPLGNKAVLYYRFTDVVEIYNIKDKSFVSVQGPEIYDAKYNVINTEVGYMAERNSETRFSFLNGVSTERFIYLLYSGNLHDSGYRDSGKYIYVYNWEGEPVGEYVLDRHILSFGVSENDELLYAFDPNSGNIVKSSIKSFK